MIGERTPAAGAKAKPAFKLKRPAVVKGTLSSAPFVAPLTTDKP